MFSLKKALAHSIVVEAPGKKDSPPLGSYKITNGSAASIVKSASLTSKISPFPASVIFIRPFIVGVLGICH